VSTMEIVYKSIGIIHSSFSDLESMPIQPTSNASGPGTVEVFSPFDQGLKGLDGFSHIILLYHLHAVRDHALIVTPFLDSEPRGIFATRAPTRPNPIGLSVVRLKKVVGNILHVEDLDVLDGAPLIDLKPYVPEFDDRPGAIIGWLEQAKGKVKGKKSDIRFIQ
jgi:tRNA-Thr(GGU) m(6)t(6)A37 methyltransferase TsaA